jgi:large subunit ribosomal protein L15
MSLLHKIKSKLGRTEPRPRIGRGGKRGKTSGRGQKGQKSRSGHRIRPAERDLIIRLPKLRGYKNKALSSKAQIVDISSLEKLSGTDVTKETMKSAGLIKNVSESVKILNGGEVKRAFVIAKNIKLSKSARAKIEAAGGKVQ